MPDENNNQNSNPSNPNDISQGDTPNPTTPPKPVVDESPPPPLGNPNVDLPPLPESGGPTAPPPPPLPDEPEGKEEDKKESKQKDNDASKSDLGLPPVLTSSKKPKGGSRRTVATILGLFLLVLGIGSGVVLVQRNQDLREEAKFVEGPGGGGIVSPSPASTPKSNNECSPGDTKNKNCTVSSTGCPGREKFVCEDGSYESITGCQDISNDNCPAETGGGSNTNPTTTPKNSSSGLGQACLKGGVGPDTRSATFQGKCKVAICPNGDTDGDGTCSVNKDTGFRYGGTVDCSQGVSALGGQCGQVDPIGTDGVYCKTSSNQGHYGLVLTGCGGTGGGNVNQKTSSTPTPSAPPPGITAQCLNVKAYDESFNLLSSSDLSNLSAGDKVIFSVAGTASSGSFTAARFVVNGTTRASVTAKVPGTSEFMDEYTIPTGVTSFSVKGQLNHSVAGWF